MDPVWIRAHNKTTTSTRASPRHQELISISNTSPRPYDDVEDLGSVYRVDEIGNDTKKFNDLFTFLNENVAGPSMVGRGRGKDIRMFPGMRDEYLYDPILEDEDSMDIDGTSFKDDNLENYEGEAVDEAILSVSPT